MPGQGIRVLHADDESGFAELAAEFVHQSNTEIQVTVVTSAPKALAALEDRVFDCVVSDFEMPEMNGIELLQHVRDIKPELPFILFTGKGSEEVASEAISKGVSDYLQKEGGTDQYRILANRITNLVRQYRAEAELATQVEQQRITAQLGEIALGKADLNELFEYAVEMVATTLENEYTKVLEYHPEDNELFLRSGVGWQDGLVGEATVGDGADSQAGHTLRSEEPIVVSDLDSEGRFQGPALLTDHDVRSGISVVIGDPADPWGVLGTHSSRPKTFSEDHVTFVKNVANVLGSAIEQRKYKQQLERSKARFDAILEHTEKPMFMKDDSGAYLFVNQAYRDLFGLQDEDIVGRTDFEIHPAEMADEVAKNDLRVIETSEPLEIEERIILKGEERIYHSTKVPIYDTGDREDSEQPVAAFGVAQDITELRQRERDLRERVKELDAIHRTRAIFDNDDQSVDKLLEEFVAVIPDSVQYPDNTAARITYDGEEFSTSDFEPGFSSITACTNVTKDVELQVEATRISAAEEERGNGFLPEEQELLETLASIARGELFERSNQGRLERLRDLLMTAEDLGDVGVWELDVDTEELFWSEGTRRIHAVVENFDPTIKDAIEFYHPDDRDRISNVIDNALEINGQYDVKARLRTAEEKLRWIRTGGQVLENGTTLRGYIQDITEQRKLQEEIEASEERLRVALDAGELGMWELDLQSEESPVRSFRHDEIFGYEEPVEEWSFEQFLEHVHPDDREMVKESFEEAFEDGSWWFTCRIERIDGVERWITVQGIFFYDEADEPSHAIGIVEDVTERKETERELHEKTERLEEFTRMVSHDIKNPLSIATGRLDLYRERAADDDLDAVEQALTRIEEITADLTALARFGPSKIEVEPVSLEETARAAWQMIDTREANLEVKDHNIVADRSQLQGIYENLFKNAVGHGGSDVIIRIGALTDGFYVEDTGVGIPPDIREQVFESGFSTGYSGSGIGLTIVSRIVEAHGWHIELSESDEGGARFEIIGVDSVQ